MDLLLDSIVAHDVHVVRDREGIERSSVRPGPFWRLAAFESNSNGPTATETNAAILGIYSEFDGHILGGTRTKYFFFGRKHYSFFLNSIRLSSITVI